MTHHPKRHRPHTRRRRTAAVATLLTLSLVGVACGSDDNSSDATSAPEATTGTPEATDAPTTDAPGETTGATDAPAATDAGPELDPSTLTAGQGVTDTEILIGVNLDSSGPYAPFAPGLKAGIDAKVGAVNAKGGLLGRQLKVEYLDDKSDPGQTLQNYKRFWEQDKVFAIYNVNIMGPPLEYVQANNIPVTLLGGPPAVFSSKYPTIIPTGSHIAAWNAQSDWAVVNLLDRHPKVVAVTYDASEEPILDFIKDYWTKLGAETILMDPYPDPSAPCDALVLKYKDAGVEYWDQHTANFLSCVPAQLVAGWHPPMGQGGPSTSSLDLSMLIGKPMADLGVIAGSPNTRADGSPTHLEPAPEHLEYQSAMKEFGGEYGNTHDINDWPSMSAYTAFIWFADGIVGGAELTGEISGDSLIEWSHQVKNWDPVLADPVRSMAPDCKTGNDSTVWGVWKWDDAKESLYIDVFAPLPGEPMINNDWIGVDECYLTQMAEEFYD